MKIPPIAADKANHAVYGAIAAGLGAALMALLVFAAPRAALGWRACVSITLATVAAAATVGLLTEWRQGKLNAAAVAMGLPPPHSVDARDALATTLGAVPVALPWLVATLMLALRQG